MMEMRITDSSGRMRKAKDFTPRKVVKKVIEEPEVINVVVPEPVIIELPVPKIERQNEGAWNGWTTSLLVICVVFVITLCAFWIRRKRL